MDNTVDSIKMSALSRLVKVGDAYNYYDNKILKISGIEISSECVETDWKETPETKLDIFFQQPDRFKYYMLGINSGLKESIEKKAEPDLNQLWFSDYTNTSTKTIGDDGNVIAQVYVFLRVIRRTETLTQRFIDSKMFDYQLGSGGKATHLVDQVSYGGEFILAIWREIDLSQQEEKENVEDKMKASTKTYFEKILGSNFSNSIKTPLELDNVNCKVYSSLFNAPEEVAYSSFHNAIKLIRDAIYSTHKEDLNNVWSSIEIKLKIIPNQLDIQLYMEMVKFYKLNNEVTMKSIQRQSKKLSKDSSLKKVPQLEKILLKFQDWLSPLWKTIEYDYDNAPKNLEQVAKKHEFSSTLLKEMEDWLNIIERQIATFSCLLQDINLNMVSWGELESRVPTLDEKCAKVFVLKTNWIPNQLMEKIKINIGRKEEQIPAAFPVLNINGDEMKEIRSKLIEFASEDVRSYSITSNPGIGYYIGLVPEDNTELSNGEIKTIEYRATFMQEEQNTPTVNFSSSIPNQNMCNQQQETVDETKESTDIEKVADSIKKMNVEQESECVDDQEDQEMASVSSHSGSTNDLIGSQELSTGPPIEHSTEMDTMTNSEQRKINQGQMSNAATRHNSTKSNEETNPNAVQNENSDQPNRKQTGAITVTKVKDPTEFRGDGKQKEQKTFNYDKRHQRVQQGVKNLANRRIAEVFVKDSNISQMEKKGKPNIFLLNAEEISVSAELRWFKVINSEVKSSLSRPNHKVIILMGATGCGKSTLINGMVNYILDVKWNDSFRFKVIREDEPTASRNQAHSQTRSVTAYTLDHQDGMTVPYSITIIDTPGYGDTRGVQRDKEITKTIHRFLSQSENQIDEIHAVCFVASSGDTRLTHTQRYILDSVLSTFGKDVKNNIRLLVTFADNVEPPVVEACKEAHFPMTSQSAGIIYCKFNSSVLYASNQQQKDDDFSFDKLFWDMGQENFAKFFKMLERMKGCDLTSTREVIRRRQQAEHALKNIEKEVDICLIKIENIEKFVRKIREHGHKMEANKNFNIEMTELRPVLVKRRGLFVAYNCRKCQITCRLPDFLNAVEKVANDLSLIDKPPCHLCSCPESEHDFQRSEWREEEVKVTRTLYDMKDEFEKSCKQQASTENIMAKCSDDLEMAKTKVLSLLSLLEENSRSLDSTALLSTALSPADYLSLMRSRVAEEQKPGYLTRLETLSELQRCLSAQASSRSTTVTRSSGKSSGSRQSPAQRNRKW